MQQILIHDRLNRIQIVTYATDYFPQQTMRKRLHTDGMHARHPHVCSPITVQEQQERMVCKTTHWPVVFPHNKQALFANESQFLVYRYDRQVCVNRYRVECLLMLV